jgi:small subunit ribosomal protein S16
MAVKIRLARGGAKKRPFYRIVAADGAFPRDGRFIERLGTYNPMVPKEHPDRVTLVEDRIKHWLSVGARPTDRVHKMLATAGIMEPFKITDQPIKSAPGKKRQERQVEQAAKKAAAAEAAIADAAAAKEAAAAEAEAAAEAPAEEAAAEAPAEEAAAEAPAEEAAAEAPAEEAAAEAPAEEAAEKAPKEG